METKVCKICGRELPLSDFPTNNAMTDGKDHRCKECKNAYMKEWQKKNREKKKARGYEGELLYKEVKITEHRINLSKLE